MIIDPSSFTLIESVFLQHIASSFDVITRYALNLFYLFATFEIVVIGLICAMYSSVFYGDLLFKILKIGMIFFLIQQFPMILGVIIKSFLQIGDDILNTKDLYKIIFNPTLIWKYGYDIGLALLKSASVESSLGLIFIQLTLGFGILIFFGLIGIKVVLDVVGFYMTGLISLIILPLAIFFPFRNMIENAVSNILRAGVKVMALGVVVGIAGVVFHNFASLDLNLENYAYNINQLFGVFFTALLFLCFAWYLPSMLSKTIGNIGLKVPYNGGYIDSNGCSSAYSAYGSNQPTQGGAYEHLVNVEVATSVETANQGYEYKFPDSSYQGDSKAGHGIEKSVTLKENPIACRSSACCNPKRTGQR